jgi:zinc transport system permease protein
MDPFLIRAFLAAIGLAIVAAPLGCVVVWQRMSYFGETMAQASLLGVALALALDANLTIGVMVIAVTVAALIIALSRQSLVPVDAILGLLHHGALAASIIALSLLQGPSVDLLGYLFGDIYAVAWADLAWVYAGGAAVLVAMAWLWPSLVRLAVHDELAAAEGVDRTRVRAMFTILLAVTIAIAMKIIGALLIIAFLIVPVVAARAFADTPERMVLMTAVIASACAVIGVNLSLQFDIPGGPAIVLVMALIAGVSLGSTAWRRSPS